jgi:hypothetical protein
MDASKRGLEGSASENPPAKRLNGSGSVEDELIDEQFNAVPEGIEDDAEDLDVRLLEEELELHLGEAGRNWERPEPPPLDTKLESFGETLPFTCCCKQACRMSCVQHNDCTTSIENFWGTRLLLS